MMARNHLTIALFITTACARPAPPPVEEALRQAGMDNMPAIKMAMPEEVETVRVPVGPVMITVHWTPDARLTLAADASVIDRQEYSRAQPFELPPEATDISVGIRCQLPGRRVLRPQPWVPVEEFFSVDGGLTLSIGFQVDVFTAFDVTCVTDLIVFCHNEKWAPDEWAVCMFHLQKVDTQFVQQGTVQVEVAGHILEPVGIKVDLPGTSYHRAPAECGWDVFRFRLEPVATP